MVAALAVVFVGTLLGGTAQAHERLCIKGDGNGYSARDVVQTIWCATNQWPVAGGVQKAIAVARCESGLNPEQYYSGNAGVFQQRIAYWPGRRAGYNLAVADRLEVAPSVYNARSNVLVSIRMVHVGGWGPWSCA
jgi:hypothetical protein